MSISAFSELTLDICIEKALLKGGFVKPTPLQAFGLPIIFNESLDVFVHAKTGSGKTLLYVLPLLSECIKLSSSSDATSTVSNKGPIAVVLVPTRDLAQQVVGVFSQFMRYCSSTIQVANLCAESSEIFLKSVLASHPQIVVATPSLLCKYIDNKSLDLLVPSFKYLVIDEADFILGIGFEQDLDTIISQLPSACRRILLSATLDDDIDALKKKCLSKPVIIKFQDDADSNDSKENGAISHFYLELKSVEDKFLLLLTLLKLKLLKGRILVFSNTPLTAYKLKLFLEAFYIRTCVLNGELPLTSRYNIIEEANRGKFDCIIAVDQVDIKSKKISFEQDFGVSRGIDFKGLSVVINFDMPNTIKSYCHRAGRTGRNKVHGTSLSLVLNSEASSLLQVKSFIEEQGATLNQFTFDMTQVEGFRYRASDVLGGITVNSINEAKLNDLKNHIEMSEKLKNHFETHPQGFGLSRHDRDLRSKMNRTHLKHIPNYLLVPSSASSAKVVVLPKLDRAFQNSISKTPNIAKKTPTYTSSKKKRFSKDPLKKIK